uniref:Rev protein n=1 Tax=Equine infectious anemia virus TaxID=11665 RepID=A0A6B9PKX5_9RETR|nr:rev protein [Equine infectious anemia virus]
MAEGRNPRDQEEKNLKEEPKEEYKEEKGRNDWWKIDLQSPLDSDQWCRVLRQSLPEEKIPSQTCMARRALGPGPVQSTPSRRERWLRGQVQATEALQEQLEWRIKGVQQTADELRRRNRSIWAELQWIKSQRGDYSSWDDYKRQEENRWGEPSSRILKPGDSKRRRKHL